MKIFASSTATMFLAAVLVGALPTERASAFAIVPAQTGSGPNASVSYDALEAYISGGGTKNNAFVKLLQPQVISIKRGGTNAFLKVLRNEYTATEGWTFNAAMNDLQGTFNITHYDAVSPTTSPGIVGVGFAFDYVAKGTDPTTSGDVTLHWIQRVRDNHSLTGGHGVAEDLIDILAPQGMQTRADVPFYDILPSGDPMFDIAPFAVPPHFEDGPQRTDPDKNHRWIAETYLASVNSANPKTVTIYNGVTWGWLNTVPEPSSVIILIIALGGLIAAGAFRPDRQRFAFGFRSASS